MLARTAERFAQTSLQLYGDEGTFATGVDTEEDLETIAQAFERLGCVVQREPLRKQVRVTAPTQGAEPKSLDRGAAIA